MVKVAIHHREGSFSDRWIEYCNKQDIDCVLVNCYDNNIINILRNLKITHLMWHISHESPKDLIAHSYVMNAADKIGVKTFPDFNTRWHFDDKVAQKYLFESKEINAVTSFVFYDEQDALQFIESSSKFPIVAKLKRGAGSTNVKLIKSKKEGIDYVKKLFNEGISPIDKPLDNFQKKYKMASKFKNPFSLIRKVFTYYKKNKAGRNFIAKEKGYAYFQEFLPNNNFDTRIIVIGNIAFGIRRFNNDNDFRASGSGKIDYKTDNINIETVKEAFLISEKLCLQCAAYDFVFDEQQKPRVIEVCFGFAMLAYDKCEGYWQKDLSFVKGQFNPQEFMIEQLIG